MPAGLDTAADVGPKLESIQGHALTFDPKAKSWWREHQRQVRVNVYPLHSTQ